MTYDYDFDLSDVKKKRKVVEDEPCELYAFSRLKLHRCL
jgi:hypothetical protein